MTWGRNGSQASSRSNRTTSSRDWLARSLANVARSSSQLPKVEEPSETKSRKKSEETGSKSRPSDDAAFLKRGMARQQKGEHDAAIADFTKAIEMNPECVQAYASRGLSKEAKGDPNGAKADYSKSIQIQIMVEINRQMRENPDVEV